MRMDLRILCASLPISSSEWYSSVLCRFPSVNSCATASTSRNGTKIVSSTFLPVFVVSFHAKTRQTIIHATPATAKITVTLTDWLLCLSVISSNLIAISTALFNAGVQSFRIESTALSLSPLLIFSMME